MMLQSELQLPILCFLVVTLLTVLCTTYAYYANAKRLDGDPTKKNYHPLAILLSPISIPLLMLTSIFLFLLRVVTYGILIILFPFALFVIRKPFLLEWLKKKAMAIGELLLEVNSLLIRIFLGRRTDSTGSP